MADKQKLFSEFDFASKKEWINKVITDLKGKEFSALDWQLEEQIRLLPFYHSDDGVDAIQLPPKTEKKGNDWEIGEYIMVKSVKEANKAALEGLMGGVDAPLFRLNSIVSEAELNDLLQQINFQYISTHFEFYHTNKVPWAFFEKFKKLLIAKQAPLSEIKGSIDFDPFLDWSEAPLANLIDLISYCSQHIPHFRVLQINGRRFHAGIQNSSHELGLILSKTNEYLAQLTNKGLNAALINQHLQFSIAISTSYFVEIAKIRALKLLWGNLAKAYNIPLEAMPDIVVHFARESQGKDTNTNMIKAATQALSAVIGGANRIYLPPANAFDGQESTTFHRRIARNVQHLLKMESFMDRVFDPSAGSYFIEKLTTELAEKAWSKFQEIEKAGGFFQY